MSIADEIRKLQELHASGALTDEEFAKAKAAVFADDKPDREAALTTELQELRLQNDLERIDREWQIERERYMFTGKYGYRYLPNRWSATLMVILTTAFGILWITMTASSGAPAFFPFIGGIIILAGVGMSVYTFVKAGEYEAAFARYQRRRAALFEDYDAPSRE